MFKYALVLIFFCSVYTTGFAQLQEEHKLARNRDRVLLDVSFTGWSHNVSSLKTKWYSRGIGLSYMYNFEISKSFDFALGVGIKNYNFYHRSTLVESTHPDTNLVGQTFSNFEAINIDSVNIKKNKLTLSYYTFPLEFRFKGKPDAKNRVFKMAIGVHANYLMNVHTKTIVGNQKSKEYNFNNFEKWMVGSHVRIGYHRMALNFETNFTGLFKSNFGPTVQPFRIGFVYTLLD